MAITLLHYVAPASVSSPELQIIRLCAPQQLNAETFGVAHIEASLCQGAGAGFPVAFLAAECGRRLAARPGRSSSLRCGRSTLTRAAPSAGIWQLSRKGRACRRVP